jgi:hypothetical protein
MDTAELARKVAALGSFSSVEEAMAAVDGLESSVTGHDLPPASDPLPRTSCLEPECNRDAECIDGTNWTVSSLMPAYPFRGGSSDEDTPELWTGYCDVHGKERLGLSLHASMVEDILRKVAAHGPDVRKWPGMQRFKPYFDSLGTKDSMPEGEIQAETAANIGSLLEQIGKHLQNDPCMVGGLDMYLRDMRLAHVPYGY